MYVLNVKWFFIPALLSLGCGVPEAPTESPGGRGGAGGAFGQVGAAIEERQAEEAAEEAEKIAAAQQAAQEAKRKQAAASTEQKVTIDDMRRGKSLRGGGYLATVLSTRFRAEHHLILIQVQQAMQLYNATHGQYPPSHDEFMKEIIQSNSIQLPELSEGFEYIYDPTDHELKMRPTEPPSSDQPQT